MRIAALLFVLAASPPVLAGDAATPAEPAASRYPRERVADIDSWIPLHCREEVRAAFVKIWEECGRGRSSKECALRIDSVPGSDAIDIVFMGPDTTRDTRDVFKRTVDVVPGKTVAIAHTHPEAGNAGVGPEDDEVPVPLNYIVAGRSGGLHRWDRDLGATRRALRTGTSWKKECTEKELEASREKLRVLRDLAASGGGPAQ